MVVARQSRADGDLTRLGIIEAAGELLGERGYDGTTAKAVSERAGVNMAAINYHFGGRDGLYVAVLREVHQRVMSLAFMRQIADSDAPPSEKLRHFLREMVRHILHPDQWALRVWAREVLSPSPLLDQVLREEVAPKFDVLAGIVAQLTRRPANDAALPQLVLSVAAPCLMLLVAGRHQATPLQPLFAQDPTELADRLWRFAMAGLQAAEKPAKR